VSIARYSLGSTQVATPAGGPAPVAPPATTRTATQSPATQPAVGQPAAPAPAVTGKPGQPATPAAANAATRWIIPGLAALGSGGLAALGVWLLYRRRHPGGPVGPGRSRMAH
jgi:hypothetical protein